MEDRICKCGHKAVMHEHMDQPIDDMIAGLVKGGSLIPQHHPDQMAITGFFMKDDNHLVPYEQIVEVLTNIRATRSRCKDSLIMNYCHCEFFKPDNLRYLEMLSERTAGKIIH